VEGPEEQRIFRDIVDEMARRWMEGGGRPVRGGPL